MALSFTLYLSGSPQDYEWLPQTDDHARQVCRQYFDLPSTKDDPPHNSDFYVELFPADQYAYYTYLHRKAVSGVPREGAHLALTVRISGGYCTRPKAIYDLLEMLYMQYLNGKIVQRRGNGEVFIVPSLTACESLRKQMETALGKALEHLLSNSLSEFGNDVSASRHPSTAKYFPADTDNDQLVAELCKTHKLRLIPSSDRSTKDAGTIKQLRAQLAQAEEVIQQKVAANERLSDQLKNVRNDTAQKKGSFSQGTEVGWREDVLGSGLKVKPQLPISKNAALLYLPWVLFAAAMLYIIISGLTNSTQESQEVWKFEDRIDQLERDLNAANKELKTKEYEIRKLKEDSMQRVEELSNIVNSSGASRHSQTRSAARESGPKPWILIGGPNDNIFYEDTSYDLSITHYDGVHTFEIIDPGTAGLAIIANDKLYCKQKGKGTIIALDADGKELRRREITVSPRPKENED